MEKREAVPQRSQKNWILEKNEVISSLDMILDGWKS